MDNLSPNSTQEPVEPKKIEEQLLQHAHQKSLSEDPEEVAAALFTLYMPMFIGGVEKLSNKQCKRILRALIETPLMDVPYSPQAQLERDIFNIGLRLLDAKYLMIMSTYNNSLDKLNEAATSPEDTSLSLQSESQPATVKESNEETK
jgi:hypothetical protein